MTNVIKINEPYVKYQTNGNEHTFTVSMSKLMDEFIEHELDPVTEKLYFNLFNPVTKNTIPVYLDRQESHLTRMYAHTTPERIIKLVVT
jgi:hypothetical protein